MWMVNTQVSKECAGGVGYQRQRSESSMPDPECWILNPLPYPISRSFFITGLSPLSVLYVPLHSTALHIVRFLLYSLYRLYGLQHCITWDSCRTENIIAKVSFRLAQRSSKSRMLSLPGGSDQKSRWTYTGRIRYQDTKTFYFKGYRVGWI